MPILDANSLEFYSRSPEQTRRLGMRLGKMLQIGDLICLQGDLGAGKTTMVQGVAQGWGALDPVSSPTFVLVNEYRRPDASCLFHLDAYRILSIPEAEELDLDNLLNQGPLVVEWPERITSALPDQHLWAQLEYESEEQRSMRFAAMGDRYIQMLEKLRHILYGEA